MDVCFVKSETYFDALRMSVGISCFVGWSEPEQMIVACGLSQLFSTQVVLPGLRVNQMIRVRVGRRDDQYIRDLDTV